MEAKAFKKPPIAFGRKVTVSNKENKDRPAAPVPLGPTPKKHNCVSSAPSRTLSVCSDDKSIVSKGGNSQGVDLIDWEARAKRAVRDFCKANGLDMNVLLPEEGKKKMNVGPKPAVAPRAPNQSGAKLFPTFKALDTLLSEKGFPPASMMELLKPLGDTFFVKRCAIYWHLYAKAATMAEKYEFGVDLLDRGTKCGAEPLMEMQRAYGTVCHRLVIKLNELKGQIPNGLPPQKNQTVAIDDADPEHGDNLERRDSYVEEKAENVVMIQTIDPADFGDNHDGIENTETDEGVETEKTVDAPATLDNVDTQPLDHEDMEDVEPNGEAPDENMSNAEDNHEAENLPAMSTLEEKEGSPQTKVQERLSRGENGEHDGDRSVAANEDVDNSVDLVAASLEQSGLHESVRAPYEAGHYNEVANGRESFRRSESIDGQVNGHHSEGMNGTGDTGTVSMVAHESSFNNGTRGDNGFDIGAGDMAAASMDHSNGAPNGSPIDQLSELPAVSMKTPRTAGRRKTKLDQNAIFKSSATKLLVVENKSAKKPKAAGGNMAAYQVTPVRRSTRKAGGYDKWLTYRTANNTVDSPSELGIDRQTAAFVKNPYLPPDDEFDSD